MSKDHLFSHLFVGDVLNNQEEDRYFLISFLQRQKTNLISRTRLLYKFDRFNHTNIHRYIDGHPYIIFLIKTEKGNCLGAYSQGVFKPNSITNLPGFLISFNSSTVFQNVKKAIVYD